jgi:hypothetical protein
MNRQPVLRFFFAGLPSNLIACSALALVSTLSSLACTFLNHPALGQAAVTITDSDFRSVHVARDPLGVDSRHSRDSGTKVQTGCLGSVSTANPLCAGGCGTTSMFTCSIVIPSHSGCGHCSDGYHCSQHYCRYFPVGAAMHQLARLEGDNDHSSRNSRVHTVRTGAVHTSSLRSLGAVCVPKPFKCEDRGEASASGHAHWLGSPAVGSIDANS